MFRFRKTRYQCKRCFKTFHKHGTRGHWIGNEVVEFPVCPHCGGDFIKV